MDYALTTEWVLDAPTEAIYAAFSDHAPDPKALQRYVATYGRNFKTVLLVGGDSYDPYDYLGLGSISFIPSFYQRVNEFVAFGPTDELVVDRDGDRIPDVPIGRLPVRTAAELNLGWLAPLDAAIPELCEAALPETLAEVSRDCLDPMVWLYMTQPVSTDSAVDSALCTRRDLNPHTLRYRNLNPARLPIPPLVR